MIALGVAVALVVTLMVGWATIRLGPRLGVVDIPGERGETTGSAVHLGGFAVMTGTLTGLAVAGVLDTALAASLLIVWAVGLVDDIWGLRLILRLLGAAIAGVVLVLVSDSQFDIAAGVFWVVAVVVVVNAIKLFDGLDVLVGSVMTVALLGISWFGFAQGVPSPLVIAVIVGSLVAFSFWNRPPARLRLGDNGAYVVGLLAVWAAMWASADRTAGVVAVALIGMPLIDLGVTLFRRGLSGSPFLRGDRDHIYDRLQQQRLSIFGVAVTVSIAQAIWVTLLVVVSIVFADLGAAISGLVLGLVIAAVVGARSALAKE